MVTTEGFQQGSDKLLFLEDRLGQNVGGKEVRPVNDQVCNGPGENYDLNSALAVRMGRRVLCLGVELSW